MEQEERLLAVEALASFFPSFVSLHQDLPSCLNQKPRSHIKPSENLLEMYIPYLRNQKVWEWSLMSSVS